MNSTPAAKPRPFVAILVVALLVLLAVTMFNLQAAKQQLERMTVRMDGQGAANVEQSKEEARKVIAQLREVYALPADTEPTVAAIVDVEALRAKNAFYNSAKNGDYLLVTTERAILFDAKQGKVLDVIPVQLQPLTPVDTAASSARPAPKKPAPAPAPAATAPAAQ